MLLSLERMNRIREVDPVADVIVADVEADKASGFGQILVNSTFT